MGNKFVNIILSRHHFIIIINIFKNGIGVKLIRELLNVAPDKLLRDKLKTVDIINLKLIFYNIIF
jgi:hypothetical protein